MVVNTLSFLGIVVAFHIVVASAHATVTKCGWFVNPTPANAWLNTEEGEWLIAVQGGYQAEGEWPPHFKEGEWVEINGHYGYGCACLQVEVNEQEHYITRILSSESKPESMCQHITP